MVTNFEQYTAEVIDKEIPVIEYIASRLKLNVGQKNQVTNNQIRSKLKDKSINISDSKLRKFIQYIRQNNLVPMLCATSRGYYVAQTVQEFIEYTQSFEERINGMAYTLKQMKSQINQHKV